VSVARLHPAAILALLASTIAAFFPVLKAGFVNPQVPQLRRLRERALAQLGRP